MTTAKRGRPTNKMVMKRPENRCPAHNRSGEQCGKSAGWGTHHLGEGVCKLHGGLTPKPTLVVDEQGLDALIEKYMEDPDIFNLTREIAVLRALRDQELERIQRTTSTLERDTILTHIHGVEMGIIRGVEKFFILLKQNQFALSIDQAHKLRESMRNVLAEEAVALTRILEPVNQPEILLAIDSWRHRVSERLRTEVVIEAPNTSIISQ